MKRKMLKLLEKGQEKTRDPWSPEGIATAIRKAGKENVVFMVEGMTFTDQIKSLHELRNIALPEEEDSKDN